MKPGRGCVLLLCLLMPAFSYADNESTGGSLPGGDHRIESRPGDVLFSHDSHTGIACKACHHDMQAGRPVLACRNCHKKEATGIMNAKQAFHKSCIGCHEQYHRENRKSGPVKLCSKCHLRHVKK